MERVALSFTGKVYSLHHLCSEVQVVKACRSTLSMPVALSNFLQADPLKWLNYACAVLTIHSGHGCTKEIQPELWTRENYRRYWKEYYAHMDAVLPSDTSRVLRYRVQEGWEPLCNFLGKEVPNEPFPHLNSRKDSRVGVAERLSTYKAMAGSNVMKMMAAPAIASMAIGAAFWLKDHKM